VRGSARPEPLPYNAAMDRDRIEQILRGVFAAEPRVVTAYLFGSVARGTASPGSDVDVAVLLEAPPPPTLAGLCLDLADDLREVLGTPSIW